MVRAGGSVDRNITRCAIYTRKSSDDGLEQEFNSLDAQREACAAYVLSQRHEGWVEVRDAYDDGGFSGGNMNRPSLKQLLADVEAGKVDIIVLYKIDRLTRSLADFAKIVEILDKRGASFVSITQSFNTTTSMGRLTLNMLLSFAQFEREVTGERIRDKFSASKAKGMWMGGPVPLGYRLEDRKLLIEESEAEIVRHIFRRYVVLGSGRALIEELRADGYRTKLRPRKDGPSVGGIPFSRGMLFAILSNRLYLGQVVHKGTAHPGLHDAIIDDELWQATQESISTNRISRKEQCNAKFPSLLVGILRDPQGRRMSPSHAVKAGRRYRYYITPSAELEVGSPAAYRIPAHDIEVIVIDRLREFLNNRNELASAFAVGARELADAIELAKVAIAKLDTNHGRRALISLLLTDVLIDDDAVMITIDSVALARMLRIDAGIVPPPILISTTAVRVRHGKDVKLVLTDNDVATDADASLVALLAEARSAREAVLASPGQTIKHVAESIGQCRSRLAKLVRLSWLAPDIVAAIVDGEHPPRLTPRKLLTSELPAAWSEQRALLGFS